MGFYDHFASRPRNPLGLWTKIRQAKRMFSLASWKDGQKPRSVLEIGPGDGYIANLCRDQGIEYLALEASAAVAARLSSKGYSITEARVPPLPAAVGTYDMCYMLHVIEHMKDMDAATTLIREIRDHLHANGRVVIACPDYGRWREHFYHDYTHSLPFTRRRLRQLLLNEGFEVVYETVYVGPVFGYVGLPLYWLARLLYPHFLDDLIARYDKKDTFMRGYWTLLPNVFIVAGKRQQVSGEKGMENRR